MRFLVLGAVLLAGLAGASAVPAADFDPAAWRAAQAAFLAENLKRDGWQATGSGLQYHIVTSAPPDAPKPAPGAEVTVHYEGRFINGQIFDSSYQRGQPATFPLNRVIQGWQDGVPMMRVGEVWEFAIPSDLAYGDADRPPIPGGSALLFRIELLEIGR